MSKGKPLRTGGRVVVDPARRFVKRRDDSVIRPPLLAAACVLPEHDGKVK